MSCLSFGLMSSQKKQFPILEAATFHFFEVISENKDVARAMKYIFEIMSSKKQNSE